MQNTCRMEKESKTFQRKTGKRLDLILLKVVAKVQFVVQQFMLQQILLIYLHQRQPLRLPEFSLSQMKRRNTIEVRVAQRNIVVRQIKRCTIHQIISGSVAIQ